MRILSVTHGPSVHGGVFDELVQSAGHDLERWPAPLGGAPQPPEAYDAVMVFGGSMHPDQDEQFPWLRREVEFLRGVLERDVPALGVCLGAQLLARAGGAAVRPAREAEIGWFDVELTQRGEADPVLGVLPHRTTAFQWHHYTFELPAGASELARNELYAQAFRLRRARGIQFHAEATAAMIETWATEDGHELPLDAQEFLAEARSRIDVWNEHGRRLCAAFLEDAGKRR